MCCTFIDVARGEQQLDNALVYWRATLSFRALSFASGAASLRFFDKHRSTTANLRYVYGHSIRM
jgi:hypothetical protein